ncbi:MAG TPA: isochorismatase family protein [Methylotenera sp.]|nr:isochorismatase family protein [Methylotenera sp.]
MHKAKLALSQLVMVDMQEKLASAMPADALKIVTKNCEILAQAARLLSIPTVLTEQYPQGLGATLSEIKQHLPHIKPIAKTAFSACGEPKFNQQLQRENSHIILAGMEAHICVLQTALDLIQLTTSGDNKLAKTVFVVEDAILSRTPANKANAIARLQQAGAVITNTESVIFEWLCNANHEAFKTLSKLIR